MNNLGKISKGKYKGGVSIITMILLLLIVISLFSSLLFYTKSFKESVEKDTFESYKSISSNCISIEEVIGNRIRINNCGNGVINNKTIKVMLNGKEIDFYVPELIGRYKSGDIIINLTHEKCNGDTYELSILSATGYSTKYVGSFPTDFDNDGYMETCYNNKIVELVIDNVRSQYLYNGIPMHSYGRWRWYPLFVDFSIGYKTILTNQIIGYLDNPAKKGDADFKIIKCKKDNDMTSCIPEPIGTTGNCNDGIIKFYDDLEENNGWPYYWDNQYRDCDNGNPQVIRTRNPFAIGENRLRIQFMYRELGGEGKYQLCIKYKEKQNIKTETPEKCIIFVSSYAKTTGTKISTSSQTFGNTISWNVNTYIAWDNSKPNYADGRRCRVYLWDYFHSPSSDIGVSFNFRRHSSWDNAWSYFGLFASSRATGREYSKINVTFDLSKVSCKVDSIYDNKCGWWWGISWRYKGKVFSCKKTDYNKWSWVREDCGNTIECDKFEHTGLHGEIFNMSLYLDETSTSWRDLRVYVHCSDPTVFGDTSRKYVVSVNGVDKFWVNDMDYTPLMRFEEAMLPNSRDSNIQSNNVGDFTCTIPLTFCGKARYFTEVWDWPLWYGAYWSGPWRTEVNGEYVCVGGSQCPYANC